MKASDIRNGNAIKMDGQTWVVVKYDHVKPGKGPAYTQVKLRSIGTGAHQEKRLRSNEEVEQVNIDRRDMEYLYADGNGYVFMDSETFEQITLMRDAIEEIVDYLKPNTVVTGMVVEGNVVAVDPPAVVDLEVTETTPVVKGATVTNQLKDAICETGLKTRVPPFIKQGEIVRIKTDTGEYVGRAGE